MQDQKLNRHILDFQRSLSPKDIVIIAQVNHLLQVATYRPGSQTSLKNITKGIAAAYGYTLVMQPFGLVADEWPLICDIVDTIPQVRQASGLLNIRLV